MDVKHVRNNQICVMLPNYVHFEELATKFFGWCLNFPHFFYQKAVLNKRFSPKINESMASFMISR